MPRLFALIIGINDYADSDIPDLRGAVGDANAVKYFLVEDVGIPERQIVNLSNAEATRVAIETEIRKLAENPAINAGNPILIYYAGYSAETVPDSQEPIEMLLPHDFSYRGSENGVPTTTLFRLLRQLKEQKGNNITIIFDCDEQRHTTRTHIDEDLSSYVLLTACRKGQSARETAGGGVFTTALLNLLRREGLDKITYEEAITALQKLPG
ncbi:hypothetical protein K435DRAFT_699019 [Dendrothele bispora CBS 962.96]|uniref:Peptidase C14 caspase domain-containing protein n=1 Tax=Dendrothele bispora (strain CBS 962.96) TaxID=1314807 RepID=A0A4S8KSY5_DENBC|nr:hypothetical protein K435DRAFT_699019 [Dendrothele bispora CBS 962.96]